MTTPNDLPESLLAWVAKTAGGTVVNAARSPARREGWQIDTRQPDGTSNRYFLRIDRDLAQGRGSQRNLRRETALIRTLAGGDIPAQKILGWNDEHCAALQSWVAGRAELNTAEPALQRTVMLEFMEIVARLHRLDIDKLDLPEFVVPRTAAEHSLLELAAVENSRPTPVSACAINPLAAFGKRWLHNHLPQHVQATVLLQGDTGPANFMYDANGVTALVDWEWGHYGDPMEDLGNIWLRDYFYPSSGGDLTPYFQHYAQRSGFELDIDRIHYYRVHQLVRSVIGLVYLTSHFDWRTPIPLNLGYRAIIDIETCRALAEANDPQHKLVEIAVPDLTTAADSLHEALAQQMENWVVPQIGDVAAANISRGHAATLRYLQRCERYAADFDAQELQSIRSLLGNNFADVAAARSALIAEIETLNVAGEARVLEYLSRMAANQAALMAPLIEPWRQCRWASIASRS
ncbi:MAG TPA: phosphotransferase [Spongiibacteraceae bacterium]|nr:phosphotransferase [Spongiibacteraceae bacterium]